MVRGPAHGPRVDVVQLAAGTWAAGRPTSSHWSRTGLALSDEVSVLKELPLAIAHGSRNGVAATCERPVRGMTWYVPSARYCIGEYLSSFP